MILKVKHRTAYYRRFQLDIWGLLRTTLLYKPAPVEPTLGDWNRFYQRTQPSRRSKDLPRVQDRWFEERKPSSFQRKILPWAYASRRLSRLLDFFFAADERRRRQRRERGRRFVYQLEVTDRQRPRRPLKHRFVSLRLVKLYYLTYSYRQFRALARSMRRRQGNFEHNFLLALESRAAPLVYRMTLLANPFHCLNFVRQGHVFVDSRCHRQLSVPVGLHRLVTFSDLGRRWIYHELTYRLGRRRLLFNVPRYLFVSFFFLFGYQRRPPVRRDLIFPIALDFYRATGYAF
jgi:hypothetical protein